MKWQHSPRRVRQEIVKIEVKLTHLFKERNHYEYTVATSGDLPFRGTNVSLRKFIKSPKNKFESYTTLL